MTTVANDLGVPCGQSIEEVFKAMLKGGFTEVAFGAGKWSRGMRILSIYAFFRQDGKVATIQRAKFEDHTGHSYHADPREIWYATSEFEAYCKDQFVTLGEKKNLQITIETGKI